MNEFSSIVSWIVEQFLKKCKTNKNRITCFVLNANEIEEAKQLFSHVLSIARNVMDGTQQKGSKVYNFFEPLSKKMENLGNQLTKSLYFDVIFLFNL
jgi:hypothetical protein